VGFGISPFKGTVANGKWPFITSIGFEPPSIPQRLQRATSRAAIGYMARAGKQTIFPGIISFFDKQFRGQLDKTASIVDRGQQLRARPNSRTQIHDFYTGKNLKRQLTRRGLPPFARGRWTSGLATPCDLTARKLMIANETRRCSGRRAAAIAFPWVLPGPGEKSVPS